MIGFAYTGPTPAGVRVAVLASVVYVVWLVWMFWNRPDKDVDGDK